jgi:hypothetical protein
MDAPIRGVRQARRLRPRCSPRLARQARRRRRLRRPAPDRHGRGGGRSTLRPEGSQLGAPADREAKRAAACARPRDRHAMHRQRKPGHALGRSRRIAGTSRAREPQTPWRLGTCDRLNGSDRTRTRDLRRDRPVRGLRRLATIDAESLYSCGLPSLGRFDSALLSEADFRRLLPVCCPGWTLIRVARLANVPRRASSSF